MSKPSKEQLLEFSMGMKRSMNALCKEIIGISEHKCLLMQTILSMLKNQPPRGLYIKTIKKYVDIAMEHMKYDLAPLFKRSEDLFIADYGVIDSLYYAYEGDVATSLKLLHAVAAKLASCHEYIGVLRGSEHFCSNENDSIHVRGLIRESFGVINVVIPSSTEGTWWSKYVNNREGTAIIHIVPNEKTTEILNDCVASILALPVKDCEVCSINTHLCAIMSMKIDIRKKYFSELPINEAHKHTVANSEIFNYQCHIYSQTNNIISICKLCEYGLVDNDTITKIVENVLLLLESFVSKVCSLCETDYKILKAAMAKYCRAFKCQSFILEHFDSNLFLQQLFLSTLKKAMDE